jgi:hypothetical protein
MICVAIEMIQWNFSKPTSTGTKNYGQFRGLAGFMRLSLQRNVQQGLKKSADIQGGPVLWGSGLEKFHCICCYRNDLHCCRNDLCCYRNDMCYYRNDLCCYLYWLWIPSDPTENRRGGCTTSPWILTLSTDCRSMAGLPCKQTAHNLLLSISLSKLVINSLRVRSCSHWWQLYIPQVVWACCQPSEGLS